MRQRPGIERNKGDGAVATQALIVLAWTYSFVPALLSILQDGRGARVGVGEQEVPSPLGGKVASLLSSLLIAICLAQIATRARQRPAQGLGRLAAYLGVWAVFLLTDLQAGRHLAKQELLYPLVGVSLWLIAPPIRVLRALAWTTIITAIMSIGLGFNSIGLYANPGGEVVDKAIVGSQLLAGPYSHPNLLGATLALGSASLALLPSRRIRLMGFITVGAALAWSASRTSIVAFGAVLLVGALGRLSLRKRKGACVLLMVFAGGLVIFTPLLVSDPRGFSNRGQIWRASLEYWRVHPLQGNGSDFYGRIGQVSNQLGPTAFTGHNELIDLLATGGLIAVFAAAIYLLTACRQAIRSLSHSPIPAMFMVALLLQSWLEARLQFANIGQVGYAIWIPMAVLLFTQHGPCNADATN